MSLDDLISDESCPAAGRKDVTMDAANIPLEQEPPLPCVSGKKPGDHWTKYEDDGTIWFYYEGPLGKWWSTGESVERYETDDEDF